MKEAEVDKRKYLRHKNREIVKVEAGRPPITINHKTDEKHIPQPLLVILIQ